MILRAIIAGLLELCFIAGLDATEPTPEQLQWLENDSLEPPEFRINLGELRFLSTPPDKPIPQSDNVFIIDSDSLASGWVSLRQCHVNLDPVPALEVVYQYRQMRGLHIVEQKNIARAEVIDNSVQMNNLQKDNRLCIEAQARVLYREGRNFKLVNGPYHRRFLDGYYPYHVSLHVRYPPQALKPVSTRPEARPGFEVIHSTGRIDIEAWFEGRLMTEIILKQP